MRAGSSNPRAPRRAGTPHGGRAAPALGIDVGASFRIGRPARRRRPARAAVAVMADRPTRPRRSRQIEPRRRDSTRPRSPRAARLENAGGVAPPGPGKSRDRAANRAGGAVAYVNPFQSGGRCLALAIARAVPSYPARRGAPAHPAPARSSAPCARNTSAQGCVPPPARERVAAVAEQLDRKVKSSAGPIAARGAACRCLAQPAWTARLPTRFAPTSRQHRPSMPRSSCEQVPARQPGSSLAPSCRQSRLVEPSLPSNSCSGTSLGVAQIAGDRGDRSPARL